MLELIEEALDWIALTIELDVDHALLFAIAGRRNAGLPSGICDQREQGIAVVRAIPDHNGTWPKIGEQGTCCTTVMLLTGREDQANGQSALVDDRIDLGAQSATRATDGVIRTPFFAPAAC